jgi:sodium/proline symporter
MALVGCAWAAFGSAFGPTIILALYWRRFTYKGAIAGIIAGFAVDAFWYCCFSGSVENLTIFNTGIYEIIPGFIISMIVAVVVSYLDKKPSGKVETLFDEAVKSRD